MSDSVRPHRQQPIRLPHPWDSPGKNTGMGCHFLLQHMNVKSESEVAQPCQLLATSWTAAHQAPPAMGFSSQEYWSGVPLPSPSCSLGNDYVRTDLFSSVQLLSCVRLFVTPWTAARQASLSITGLSCLLKLPCYPEGNFNKLFYHMN